MLNTVQAVRQVQAVQALVIQLVVVRCNTVVVVAAVLDLPLSLSMPQVAQAMLAV